MRKKSLATVIALSCLAIAGLLMFSARLHEPVHNGRPLGEWMGYLDSTNPPAQRQIGIEAVRAIGTNALPILVKNLREDDASLSGWLRELRRYQNTVDFTPSAIHRWRAIYGFRALGAEARPAIPELTGLLNEESTCVGAVFALMAIGPEAEPVLKGALASTNEYVRHYAAWGLGRMRSRV